MEKKIISSNEELSKVKRETGCLENLEIRLKVTLPLDSGVFSGRVEFIGCSFKEDVSIFIIRNEQDTLTFDNCEFKKVSANGAIINGKIRFRECRFYEVVDFQNTTFNNLADFWRCTFYKKTIFYKTNFTGTTVFSAVIFNENVLFTYSLIGKLLLLRGTKVKKGLDLSLAIIAGELGVFDFILDDYDSINIHKETLKTKGSRKYEEVYENMYETAVYEGGEIPLKNKRETYRIFKKNHENNGNIIESLPFKVLEKESLRYELRHTTKSCENYVNRFILWINKHSNNYGTSVIKSIIFTLGLGWIFFYVSLLGTESYGLSIYPSNWEFWKGAEYFIQFLIPTHKFNYLGENGLLSFQFYLFDFLGRMTVGYGIYQTIQAFRKYK